MTPEEVRAAVEQGAPSEVLSPDGLQISLAALKGGGFGEAQRPYEGETVTNVFWPDSQVSPAYSDVDLEVMCRDAVAFAVEPLKGKPPKRVIWRALPTFRKEREFESGKERQWVHFRAALIH